MEQISTQKILMETLLVTFVPNMDIGIVWSSCWPDSLTCSRITMKKKVLSMLPLITTF